MKKILFGILTLALVLTAVASVDARGGRDRSGGGETDVDNKAFVGNLTVTVANSGFNKVSGKYVWGGSVRTGAATAVADVYNDVNSTTVRCNTCRSGAEIDIDNDRATVLNVTGALANSGVNSVSGRCVGGGSVTTGAAGASSVVTNLVNTSVVR